MIKLIVADTMQPDGSIGCYHKVERRTDWSPFGEWRGQSARCNPLLTDESHAHESARGMRLEVEWPANLVSG